MDFDNMSAQDVFEWVSSSNIGKEPNSILVSSAYKEEPIMERTYYKIDGAIYYSIDSAGIRIPLPGDFYIYHSEVEGWDYLSRRIQLGSYSHQREACPQIIVYPANLQIVPQDGVATLMTSDQVKEMQEAEEARLDASIDGFAPED